MDTLDSGLYLSNDDVYLLGNGKWYRSYEKLGAHHEGHEPTDDQQRRHARILEGRAGPLTDNLLRDAL